jgi:hypothetical protein
MVDIVSNPVLGRFPAGVKSAKRLKKKKKKKKKKRRNCAFGP